MVSPPTTQGAETGGLGSEGHVVNQEGARCANSACECGGFICEEGGYLHRNRETEKLLVLCPGCSLQARLHDSLRLPLVAL